MHGRAQADGGDALGAELMAAQEVRQLVGAAIQLGVGERRLLADDGDGVRGVIGGGLEELRQRLIQRARPPRVVPL